MKDKKQNQVNQGVLGIAITSMNSERELDEGKIREHLQFLVSNGINKKTGGIIVGGSTGECAAMTIDERKKLAEIAIDEIADEVPVIIGCNHSDVNQTIELVKHAETSGAAEVMILPQYYFTPPTDEGVLAFIKLISSKTDIGILFYNNAGITKYDVPVEVMSELADTSNVVGIKECTPWIAKMEEMTRKVGDRISVFNGQGEFFEPYAALAGTHGFISSTVNLAPKQVVELWNARSKGDFETANQIRRNLTPYLDLLVRTSSRGGEPTALAIIKKATDMVGSYAGPGRLPLLELKENEEEETKNALTEMGLIE
jgi:4-hydroxy-tetrahydrodipicolinate synthase